MDKIPSGQNAETEKKNEKQNPELNKIPNCTQNLELDKIPNRTNNFTPN